MATDFKYIPLAPEALSGPSFIDQTEMAINEINNRIDNVDGGSEEAIEKANQALNTANSALQTANDAQGIAQDAQTTAENAQNTADGVSGIANEALSTANNALDEATVAQSTAETAQTAAETAQTAAETAQTAADGAQTSADTAQTTADNAADVAINALGKYTVFADETLDANIYYTSAQKLYITGASVVNFPIFAPFYFDVYFTSDNTRAFQKVFTASEIWQREARIDNTDPENTIIVWSSWEETVGGGSSQSKDAILGAITINNPSSDINALRGYNGRFYITNPAIAGLPVAEAGLGEAISDTLNTNTSVQYATASKDLYYMTSSSQITPSTGNTFWVITATSGTDVVYETLVFRSAPDTQTPLSLTAQRSGGGNGTFEIEESATTGLVIAGKIDFYSNNTAFRENGFTLTVQQEIGGSPVGDMIQVEFPAYGDGDPVVTQDTIVGTNANFKYQSGEQTNAGGSDVKIYISATWTNYTGTVEWSDWVKVNRVAYSTDEKLTGDIWIDGKPIYSKTILTPGQASAPWTVYSTIQEGVIDTLVNMYGHAFVTTGGVRVVNVPRSGVSYLDPVYSYDGSTVQFNAGTDYSQYSIYLTFCYTKV